MGKNINGTSTTDSSGVCEKLFSVITASPAFQTIRRLSSPARDPSPLANLNHAAGKKVIDIQSKPEQTNKPANQVIQVPIKLEKAEVLQPASTPNENRKLSTSHKAAAKIEPEPAQVAQKKVIAIEHITYDQEGKKKKHNSESSKSSLVKGAVGEGQRFNDAMKVEKAQQVQAKNEGKQHAGGVDINDKFTQYITQAKIKIRTMSSNKTQESDHEGYGGGKDVHFSDFIDRAKNKFKSSTSNAGGMGKTVSLKRNYQDRK